MKIAYEEIHEGQFFRIDASYNYKGRRVPAGYIQGVDQQEDGWLLGDFCVFDKVELERGFFGLFKKEAILGGQGIGSELLRRFEEKARSCSGSLIHGVIAETDRVYAERLQRWYERHEYTVAKTEDDSRIWGTILKRLR